MIDLVYTMWSSHIFDKMPSHMKSCAPHMTQICVFVSGCSRSKTVVECGIQIVLVGSGVSMSARWSVTNPVPPCYSFTSDMVIHGNLVIHGNHSAR